MEFTLVFPFFIVLLFSVVEFAFALNALLSVDFATREAALAAAEAGNDAGADCAILRAIEKSVEAPSDDSRITQVRIYRSNPNGTDTSPVKDIRYARGGTIPCPTAANSSATLPYAPGVGSYAATGRCNVLAGCDDGPITTGPKTVDTIGVEMTYVYQWRTPLPGLLQLPGTGYTMTKGNAMRMEPVL